MSNSKKLKINAREKSIYDICKQIKLFINKYEWGESASINERASHIIVSRLVILNVIFLNSINDPRNGLQKSQT